MRSPAKRQQQVYLDYLQNRRGQTLAAPYCVRPVPGAVVSTPLKWSEVKRGLDPTRFTMKTIHRRLDRVFDRHRTRPARHRETTRGAPARADRLHTSASSVNRYCCEFAGGANELVASGHVARCRRRSVSLTCQEIYYVPFR